MKQNISHAVVGLLIVLPFLFVGVLLFQKKEIKATFTNSSHLLNPVKEMVVKK